MFMITTGMWPASFHSYKCCHFLPRMPLAAVYQISTQQQTQPTLPTLNVRSLRMSPG